MSLYAVATSQLRSRKAQSVFFNKNDAWLCLKNKHESLVFEHADLGFEVCFSLVRFAEEKGIAELEIKLCEEWVSDKEDAIKNIASLATYLLDKDLSVGLLFDGVSYLRPIRAELETMGIPSFFKKPPLPVGAGEILFCCAPPRARPAQAAEAPVKSKIEPRSKPLEPRSKDVALGDINLDEPFRDKLMKHLIESGKTNADIYRKSGVSKQVFSKIISTPDMVPTKGTILCLAIGLELSLRETVELLQSAGYALSKSITLDVVVARYISVGVYDLDRINSDLNEFGCPILGWRPREN